MTIRPIDIQITDKHDSDYTQVGVRCVRRLYSLRVVTHSHRASTPALLSAWTIYCLRSKFFADSCLVTVAVASKCHWITLSSILM